jgi:hypothetical protein
MEAIRLLISAVGLVACGCVATVLSAHLIPLWIRVLGQPHGRFAGLLGASQSPSGGGGSKRGRFHPASLLRGRFAPSPTVV